MEQRKNAKILKILIITISIMVLILIGVIAYLYFQTDICPLRTFSSSAPCVSAPGIKSYFPK